jgi:hypothetical protein
MAYSSGLPILYPFAAIFFAVLYAVYKFLLLKYYAKTTKFNEELPMISIAYIKVALVIHMVFTVFMISNAKLLPLQEGGLIDIKTIFKVSDSNFIVQLFSRFLFRGYALLYIAGVALLIVLAIFKTILLDPIYNLCCGSCCNRKSAT